MSPEKKDLYNLHEKPVKDNEENQYPLNQTNPLSSSYNKHTPTGELAFNYIHYSNNNSNMAISNKTPNMGNWTNPGTLGNIVNNQQMNQYQPQNTFIPAEEQNMPINEKVKHFGDGRDGRQDGDFNATDMNVERENNMFVAEYGSGNDVNVVYDEEDDENENENNTEKDNEEELMNVDTFRGINSIEPNED